MASPPLRGRAAVQAAGGDAAAGKLRDRAAQTKFTLVVPPHVNKMGFAPSALAPSRSFIQTVDPGSWAVTVGLRLNDEILEVGGLDILTLDAESFKLYLMEVRPLSLCFGRSGFAPGDASADYAGITVEAFVPQRMLPECPWGPNELAQAATATQDLCGKASRARWEFEARFHSAFARPRPIERQPDLTEMEHRWGHFQVRMTQPVGDAEDAEENIRAAAQVMTAKRDFPDDALEFVLGQLREVTEGRSDAAQEALAPRATDGRARATRTPTAGAFAPVPQDALQNALQNAPWPLTSPASHARVPGSPALQGATYGLAPGWPARGGSGGEPREDMRRILGEIDGFTEAWTASHGAGRHDERDRVAARPGRGDRRVSACYEVLAPEADGIEASYQATERAFARAAALRAAAADASQAGEDCVLDTGGGAASAAQALGTPLAAEVQSLRAEVAATRRKVAREFGHDGRDELGGPSSLRLG